MHFRGQRAAAAAFNTFTGTVYNLESVWLHPIVIWVAIRNMKTADLTQTLLHKWFFKQICLNVTCKRFHSISKPNASRQGRTDKTCGRRRSAGSASRRYYIFTRLRLSMFGLADVSHYNHVALQNMMSSETPEKTQQSTMFHITTETTMRTRSG